MSTIVGGRMADNTALMGLEAYARKCIAAHRYPNDYHFFRPTKCSTCGVVPVELTIERHTGSRKEDFKGVIIARCSVCEVETRFLSFTGDHRRWEREERSVCECGSVHFLVEECERIERDEGVVVGQCLTCGCTRAFVYID